MEDYLNYPKIIDDAMHVAIKRILTVVAHDGLKGDHHFYVSFITHAKGVKLSDRVKAMYPDEITIVLQYQFQDLIVKESCFSIRLSFDGISEVVVVPYEAITSFEDPSEKFSLIFNYYLDREEASEVLCEEEEAGILQEIRQDAISSSNVIELDKFRKNRTNN